MISYALTLYVGGDSRGWQRIGVNGEVTLLYPFDEDSWRGEIASLAGPVK